MAEYSDSDGSEWRRRWRRWLARLRGPEPITDADLDSIQAFTSDDERDPDRVVVPIDPHIDWKDYTINLCEKELVTYRRACEGLWAHGYGVLHEDDAPVVVPGLYGQIFILYKIARYPVGLHSPGRHLQSKHMALAKVQRYERVNEIRSRKIGIEYACLRALKHDNVVTLKTAFAVVTNENYRYEHLGQAIPTDSKFIWLVLEYANAGDLEKERKRHEKMKVPFTENGVRYYMQQVVSGLMHIHSHGIVHRDLHAKNVLLKYRTNGSKVAMIADFGNSALTADLPDPSADIEQDVLKVIMMMNHLITRGRRSVLVSQLIAGAYAILEKRNPKYWVPSTAKGLKDHPWTSSDQLETPMPKLPTPLLDPLVVDSIGYRQPIDPAGTMGTPDVVHYGPRNLQDDKRHRVKRPLIQRVSRAIAQPVQAAVRGIRRIASREPWPGLSPREFSRMSQQQAQGSPVAEAAVTGPTPDELMEAAEAAMVPQSSPSSGSAGGGSIEGWMTAHGHGPAAAAAAAPPAAVATPAVVARRSRFGNRLRTWTSSISSPFRSRTPSSSTSGQPPPPQQQQQQRSSPHAEAAATATTRSLTQARSRSQYQQF